MLSLKVIKHALKSRITSLILNLLLVLAILLQGAYLYLRSSPEILRNLAEGQIRRKLAESNLELTMGALEVNSLANIRVRNLAFREEGKPGTLAMLKEVRFTISPVALLLGRPQINQLEIHGGTLNCPAIASPSGREESLLQNLRATLRPHGRNWELRNCSFDLHNALVTGVFHDGPPLLIPAQGDPKTRGLPERFQKMLADLLRTRPRLAKLDSPVITLLSRKDGQTDVQLQAKGVQIPSLLTSGALTVSTRLQHESRHILFTSPVNGRLDNALLKQDLRVTSLHFQLPAPSTEIRLTLFPLEVKVSSGAVQFEDELAGRFIGKLRMEDANHLAFDGAVGFRHSFAEITFNANLEKKTADIRTRFQIQPGDILGLQAFIDRKHLEQAKFRAPLAGKLQARYDEDWVLGKAVFNIRAEQLEILEVPLASLQASGTYEPGFLEVPEISAQLKPGEVTGSFRQNLGTGDYRFLLEGNLFPSQLNPWFRPWWDSLWGKFQFTGLPLQANIDVSGRWKDLSRRDIFGSGEISSASYKGAPFERVQGQLRCIPKYTELFDLNAKFPDGHARGRLAWTLHPEERSHVTSRRFNLRGKLNLETAGKLFGSKVEKVLADFTVEETPDVVAEGVLFGKGPFDFLEKPPLNDFTVQSQTGKAAFLSIPLDFLQIDLHNLGHAITIDPLHFGFAGGKAEGWLKHRHNPEGPPMEFSIHLKDADKHLAIQNLSQNPKLNLKPSKPPKKKATFQAFQIHATGDHGDLSSFDGSGSFALRDPGLAQINMLGLFSKELKRFTLPLISYSFDRMEAKFKLRKQFMVFDPQPLIVRGPTSKLDATGSFNIKTRELDFKIRLLQLGLLPLAGILEMNLGGTIDKPVWNPKVKPSATLDPFKPLNPKNGKSLPLKSKDQK